MLYPILLEHIYKETVWGGTALAESLNRDLPSPLIGESWDVSCREKEISVISNGSHKGKNLKEFINTDPKEILGEKLYQLKDFPLLVKLISAKDDLSVQVHPTDEYAQKNENYIYGKKEMWYILHAPANGKLVVGLKKGICKEAFVKAIESKKTEECLSYLPIKRGDVINISEGLVHAITKDVLLLEIQQNSDITYRVYDYDRKGLDGKPRELHIEKALDVIDFEDKLNKNIINGLTVKNGGNKYTYLISNDCFTIIKYEIGKYLKETSDFDKFYIFTCIEGECVVKNSIETIHIKMGDSFFIPAFMGEYEILGKCSLLKSFVGDRKKDFEAPLKNASFSAEKIEML